MTTELQKQAVCYGCYDDKTICGFIGVIHFPHPVNKKIKSISRLCVLPDYQGIGIGRRFLNVIAKKYADEGFDVKITTSAKNLMKSVKTTAIKQKNLLKIIKMRNHNVQKLWIY